MKPRRLHVGMTVIHTQTGTKGVLHRLPVSGGVVAIVRFHGRATSTPVTVHDLIPAPIGDDR